jgi:hypothetical protein
MSLIVFGSLETSLIGMFGRWDSLLWHENQLTQLDTLIFNPFKIESFVNKSRSGLVGTTLPISMMTSYHELYSF